MSIVGPTVPGPPREDSLTLSSFRLQESKLRPPWARPGIVPRTKLVELLMRTSAPVVSVVAPPGYGKTTALAQWADRKGRMAWVGIDRRDNDPAILLTYVAAAVDRIESLGPDVFHALASPGTPATTIVSRLIEALTVTTEPIALVLDNLEFLEDQPSLDVVAELAVQFSARAHDGSQLALVSRANPPLPMALLRAQGRLVEVGVEELAMDQQEAQLLLEGAGVQPAEVETTDLIRWTEGWPVGLYLAALSLKTGSLGNAKEVRLSGGDRFVADYLWSELLARVPPETVSFLTRTSVLDRMSGPLCDAVLDATGSAETLERLQRSNLLVIPLDDRRQWYRYHHLFGELLHSELERCEPELMQQLHLRAASWYEANGMPEAAIDHAQAAGGADQVARLVAGLVQPTAAAGRVDTARRWLEWFQDHGLVERYPPIAVLGAFVHALWGQPAAAERWADAAETRPFAGTLPDGSTMGAYRALLRALLCRDGVNQMRVDAQAGLDGLSPQGQLRAIALLLLAFSHLLEGEADRADPILAHAIEVGTQAGALPAVAIALAERGLVAIEHQRWNQAETFADQAYKIVQAGRLADYIPITVVYAVLARTAARRSQAGPAQGCLARAARLRPQLSYATPYLAVQTLLELGHSYLALGHAGGAKVTLREAKDILYLRPNLGVLNEQADELRSQLDMIDEQTHGASSLTKAELRLLPLLSTHFTFREIGERLYVSPNTVKRQAVSLYRKLEVTSRSRAVQRAQEPGLGS
jgi:LuxR family transcriptional regulator, maltose regulon positive regulatory protein